MYINSYICLYIYVISTGLTIRCSSSNQFVLIEFGIITSLLFLLVICFALNQLKKILNVLSPTSVEHRLKHLDVP